MTSKTFAVQDVLEAAPRQLAGTRGGGPNHQARSAETRFAFFDSPPRAHTELEIITVQRTARVEHLPLLPVQGVEPVKSVTEIQARSLLALALVDTVCRSRRGVVVALRMRRGVSVAAINAALRIGAGNRLPVAEDNHTVRRVAEAGVAYYEHDHVAAWDDGRPGVVRDGRE